jgi:hypothetical protein
METTMSPLETAFLVLVAAAFLTFIVAVGALQWWLSREPGERYRKARITFEPAGRRRAF